MTILDSNTIIYLSKQLISIDDIFDDSNATLITNDIRLQNIDNLRLKLLGI